MGIFSDITDLLNIDLDDLAVQTQGSNNNANANRSRNNVNPNVEEQRQRQSANREQQSNRGNEQIREQRDRQNRSYMAKSGGFGKNRNTEEQRRRIRRGVTEGPSHRVNEQWKITNQLKPWITDGVKKP
ncbi:MAG: hypothetical protein LBT37_03650 [Lactobacillaceae bacterium]|jgi:hypothetical protein|nr:hypothetical protein [Lactobacillaceae bacterium]